MIVVVTFTAARFGLEEDRGITGFWSTVKNLNNATYERYDKEIIGYTEALSLERRFSHVFPETLSGLINDKLYFDSTNKALKRPIIIRLLNIEYGSLKAILDIAGIDNAEMRELVLTALGAYAPQALREAMSMEVNLPASAVVLMDGTPSEQSSKPDDKVPEKFLLGIDRSWVIANTSLILPVMLALLILYYLNTFYIGQLDRLNSELAGLRAERTEYIKMLSAQNAKAIEELVKQSNINADIVKSTIESFAGIAKGKAEENQKKP